MDTSPSKQSLRAPLRLPLLALAICAISQNALAIVTYSTNLKPAAPGYPSSLTLYAYCQDIYTGVLYAGTPISLSDTWVANSNSHLHAYSPGHPQSTLSNSNGYTGSNGYFQFDVQATQIGQDEYLTIHCAPPPGENCPIQDDPETRIVSNAK